jgi:hypothetical protein
MADLDPDLSFGAQDPQRGVVKRWWRIEIDGNGKAGIPVPVEALGENGLSRVYVLAYDIKQASKAGFNAYCALRNQIRRARYDAEGKCGCGRVRDIEGKKKCKECIKQRQRSKSREKQKKRGEPLEVLDKTETYRKRREDEARQSRLAVLTEVRAAWQNMNTVRAFSAWLAEQILAAGEQQQLKGTG